jgi:hypothetical protein
MFPENGVIAGRSAESRFAGGNRRFTHEGLAFVKISPLLGDADDDFRGPGNAVAMPVTRRRRRGSGGGRRRRYFGATGDQHESAEAEKEAKGEGAAHLDAQINVFRLVFNLKDLGSWQASGMAVLGVRRTEILRLRRSCSCPGQKFLILSPAEENFPICTAL